VATDRFSLIDSFCGAGGLSLGLLQAGFRTIFAFDSDGLACQTYNANLDPVAHTATMKDIGSSVDLIRPSQRLDLLAGGPPCQGFSSQRRGSADDSRNELVGEYIGFAIALRPRVLLLENVPGLIGSRGRAQLAAGLPLLQQAGYDWTSAVLDAADFGVPQRRLRAIVVAWDPQDAKPFRFPEALEAPRVTVRDAIGDLPEPPDDYSVHPSFPNHVRVRMSARNLERISHVPPGGGRLDIPSGLQLPCHRGTSHRHLDVYGRMQWDEPAPTITAMFDNFTRGRFAHPDEDRNVTGREGARLQSFPDTFNFVGPKKDVARQIGNAVPPRLAIHIGTALIECLS
jgi:DNA (cytosine-5)-methyltransferase 1